MGPQSNRGFRRSHLWRQGLLAIMVKICSENINEQLLVLLLQAQRTKKPHSTVAPRGRARNHLVRHGLGSLERLPTLGSFEPVSNFFHDQEVQGEPMSQKSGQ